MLLKTEYSPLLETFKFANGIELKNRVVMAPMTNFSSNEDGTVSEPELDYYIRRSKGAGMVITACVYVSRGGKGFPGEFGADHDGLIPSLRGLAEAIKGEGAKAVLQIFHGGRQCPRHSCLTDRRSAQVMCRRSFRAAGKDRFRAH